jgi:hypothetical protein
MSTNIRQLRSIIKKAIAPTILKYRKTKLLFKSDKITGVTENEVNEFLFCIPYFEKALSYYLLGDGKIANTSTSLFVRASWVKEFKKRVEYWAHSTEWLNNTATPLHHPGYRGRALIDDDPLRLPRLIFDITISSEN